MKYSLQLNILGPILVSLSYNNDFVVKPVLVTRKQKVSGSVSFSRQNRFPVYSLQHYLLVCLSISKYFKMFKTDVIHNIMYVTFYIHARLCTVIHITVKM